MQSFSYAADQAWAASAAAYRINGNSYLKNSQTHWSINENQYVTVYDNKTLLRDIINKNQGLINDQDVLLGNQARTWWSNQLLMLLDDAVHDYNKKMVQLAVAESISTNVQLGLLASAIKSYIVNLMRQEQLEIKQALNSQPIGEVGYRLFNYEVSIISSRKSVKYESNFTEATDGTNLFTWWGKKLFDFRSTVKINARLKNTEFLDRDTGQVINQLNYVSIIKP